MNVNKEIQELEIITGLQVSPDMYSGSDEKYITYEYTDERPIFWGDDTTLYDQATIRINLYTPPKFNYMELKHSIRNYLESIGEVETIESWIEKFTSKNNLEETIRHTSFNLIITKER